MSRSIKSTKPPKPQKPPNNNFIGSMISGFGVGIGIEGARTVFSSILGNTAPPITIPKFCDTEATLLIECVKNPESNIDCYKLFQKLQQCYKKI